MSQYISLLRGINASGQKKILMKDLKGLYEKLGLSEVRTYIQSGNVVFQSDLDALKLQKMIEEAITAQYNFDVPVCLRTYQELRQIMIDSPFESFDLAQDGSRYGITFFQHKIEGDSVSLLKEYLQGDEKIALRDSELYFYAANGFGKTKLSNAFIEKKLANIATTRNYKTLFKLLELAL